MRDLRGSQLGPVRRALRVLDEHGNLVLRRHVLELHVVGKERRDRDGALHRQCGTAPPLLAEADHRVVVETEARHHAADRVAVVAGNHAQVVSRAIAHAVRQGELDVPRGALRRGGRVGALQLAVLHDDHLTRPE
jgi:hypothetical protein